jgi:uncharacterized protein (TIGR02145 family)
MKKLLFLLTVFCSLQANAQSYSISFSGTGLSVVKVQNLTTGVIVDVPGGDVLLLSTPTGIPEVNNMKSSGLKVYPNPMTDKSTLEILPPLAGDAIITVCDLTGKVLTQYKGYVENYTQDFSLSGIKNGLHIITIQGNGYQISEKLLSNGKSTGTANIVKISNNIQTVAEKKSIQDSKGVQATVNMAYTAGQRLKYTAVSGNNKTVITDIPTANKTVTFTFTECKDGDNIYYPIVVIGTQTWMAENLKTTKYRNGDLIGTTSPYTKDISVETDPKYQWAYDGNESNVATYGRLYTWYAVTDTRNVCPTGWHLPLNLEDWNLLENYLLYNGFNYDGTAIGNKYAKSLASTSGWTVSSTTGAVGNTDYPGKRNASGFTALPGGSRYYDGTFDLIGYLGYWWSASQSSPTDARDRNMDNNKINLDSFGSNKMYGLSVRCVMD